MKINIYKKDSSGKKAHKTWAEVESEYMMLVVKSSKNYSDSINRIGISRATFYRKMNKNLKARSKNYFYKENVKFAS